MIVYVFVQAVPDVGRSQNWKVIVPSSAPCTMSRKSLGEAASVAFATLTKLMFGIPEPCCETGVLLPPSDMASTSMAFTGPFGTVVELPTSPGTLSVMALSLTTGCVAAWAGTDVMHAADRTAARQKYPLRKSEERIETPLLVLVGGGVGRR